MSFSLNGGYAFRRLGYGAEGGYEWTVEGTRAGPRDTRRLDDFRVKSEKKGGKCEKNEFLFKWGVCL